ncbi:MAG: helix-turn-helix transcriptional regulator [Desulfobacterales bacterium]|jgi:putative transcriptional regulator|nr:helix-turn-helix transcriptional regulator [Desulfobacterales bacterium]MDD3082778.1 helix-turn-helix transcriptional regulator [Desulfobacterales bacterium]MDD3951855.1 helix-turn-helix transcriptional regulator [Desulfobacterales bacterium]MDD4464329.1 helix-turn-helix transcriptional regulator [Desulfobacterales bacterium]MDY0377602.1 helix-turn-helix transcriptional regulator [Desulfobacterales bacterium]
MIKYNLKELIAEKEFREKRSISIGEIAEAIGISRTTLSKIANSKGNYSTKTEYIEKLCKYFGVTPDELMRIIPDPPDK